MTAERVLLDRQAVRLHRAWRGFIRAQQSPDTIAAMLPLFQRRDLKSILATIEAEDLGDVWNQCAADVANDTASRVQRKLSKAAPKVTATFTPGDPAAARLMQQNNLRFVTALTLGQRQATAAALTRAARAGWSTERTAAAFKDSIGLLPTQVQHLQRFENALLAGRAEELALAPADRGPVLTDAQIADRVDRQRQSFLQARTEMIARTESLRVTSLAQDISLRESLANTGIDARKVLKTWNTTRDGRERPEHAERDGVTIPLDEAFAPGIYKPGDGGPREAIGCRCVLTFSFED